MSRRPAAAAVLLTGLAGLTACDVSEAPLEPLADVRGTPFLRPARAPSADGSIGEQAIGDVDASASRDATTGAMAALVTATPRAVKPPAAGEYKSVSFDDLASFEYAAYASDASVKHEVPEKVRSLSGRKVAVDGYMMPLSYEAGGAKKFLLMKNQFGCCFAVTPMLNEWIEVTMEGGAVADYVPHLLVTAWGVLEVRAEARDGVASGLYKMKATRTQFTEAR